MNNKNFKKYILTLKIIIFICAIASIALLCELAYEYIKLENVHYFVEHFTPAICMWLVGIIALLLPQISRPQSVGNDRGDETMVVVGVLLFLCGIIAIIWSYLGF